MLTQTKCRPDHRAAILYTSPVLSGHPIQLTKISPYLTGISVPAYRVLYFSAMINLASAMEESPRPTPINRETGWDKSKILMSKTDPYGVIEYANDAFIEVSGYEEHELMGKPHNIIRHPDMPRVIFKVLWDYLKKGRNIHAIVKNMSKSGRYYWVITDFEVNTNDKGAITSYYGRRRAAPVEIVQKHIEPLYDKLLQIEAATGMVASEKYLIGFLEDIGKTYNEFVEDIITDGLPPEEKQAEEKKGFFTKLFAR